MLRFGRRIFMIGVIVAWMAGLALLLASPVAMIMLGLSLCAGCGMLCQATSTGYVTASVHEGRSSAIGLYVTCFYIGGSVGGLVAGVLWSQAGWPAVVALSAIVLAMMGVIVTFAWSRSPMIQGSPRHGDRTAFISLGIQKLVRFHKIRSQQLLDGKFIP